MQLTEFQWLMGCCAAMLVGFSKTGMPGVGILVVPMLVFIFPGRLSTGAMLPMLLFADVFAVIWYSKHTRWDKLWGLIPWVLAGFVMGTVLFLNVGPKKPNHKDIMDIIIGAIVLVMLGLHLLRQKMGDKLTPHSSTAVIATGCAAGFTTMVSNAAGPVMTLYLQGMGMSKEQFIGTSAWFFFLVNLSKLPVYIALNSLRPETPMITAHSLLFNLYMMPVILLGVLIGKWLLPRIPQKTFDAAVLILAGIAALKLVAG